MCVLIRVTEYIHDVLKTFLPLVTRPCRFDQITRGKIKPRTEGFINHVLMAAILIFNFDFHRTSSPGSSRQIEKRTLGERLRSAKTRAEWGPKLDQCCPGGGFSFICFFLFG